MRLEREQLYSTIRNQYENCVVKLVLDELEKKIENIEWVELIDIVAKTYNWDLQLKLCRQKTLGTGKTT